MALREFAIHSTSMALRDCEVHEVVYRTGRKNNERAVLTSTMDVHGNVLYRIETRTSVDAIELEPADMDSLAFVSRVLRQFLRAGGWTHFGPDRQRV